MVQFDQLKLHELQVLNYRYSIYHWLVVVLEKIKWQFVILISNILKFNYITNERDCQFDIIDINFFLLPQSRFKVKSFFFFFKLQGLPNYKK